MIPEVVLSAVGTISIDLERQARVSCSIDARDVKLC